MLAATSDVVHWAVGILSGLVGGHVDQAAYGAVGEREPVDLLADQVGRFAAQGGARSEHAVPDLVAGGLDLPPLVIQRRELDGNLRIRFEQWYPGMTSKTEDQLVA